MPTLKSGESGVYARINSIKLRVAIIPSKFHADIWESQYNGKIKVKVNTLAFLGLKIYLFLLGLTGIWRRTMNCLDKKKSRRIIIAETALTTLTANETNCSYNQFEKCWDTRKKWPFLLLVTGLWDTILTSLLPPIQSCSSNFLAWPCIASNFNMGWRGVTSTRSWTGHLSQITVQCLKYFCNCIVE